MHPQIDMFQTMNQFVNRAVPMANVLDATNAHVIKALRQIRLGRVIAYRFVISRTTVKMDVAPTQTRVYAIEDIDPLKKIQITASQSNNNSEYHWMTWQFTQITNIRLIILNLQVIFLEGIC